MAKLGRNCTEQLVLNGERRFRSELITGRASLSGITIAYRSWVSDSAVARRSNPLARQNLLAFQAIESSGRLL
jgi:hypothetical protein